MLCKETLKRVTSIAEQSKILALGESKHTSDGLCRAKVEVIRHLVEKGEVNCVLFENSWSRAEKVNAFLNSEASLEEAMASIAKQLIKGGKAVLWAHNLHIMKNGRNNRAWPMKTMRDCLCADYGEAYKAMALTAYRLEVNWPGDSNEKGAPIPHPDDSIEEKLRESGIAERMVNFSRKEDKLEFGGCRKMFEAVDVEDLENHFDAILYLEESPAMEAFDC